VAFGPLDLDEPGLFKMPQRDGAGLFANAPFTKYSLRQRRPISPINVGSKAYQQPHKHGFAWQFRDCQKITH
jgi:hypothetical protein